MVGLLIKTLRSPVHLYEDRHNRAKRLPGRFGQQLRNPSNLVEEEGEEGDGDDDDGLFPQCQKGQKSPNAHETTTGESGELVTSCCSS